MTMSSKIRRLIKQGKTPSQTAKALKIRPARVYTVLWLDKNKQQKVMPEQSPDPAVRDAEAQYIKKANAAYKTKKSSKIIDAVNEMKTALDALDKIKDKPKYRMAAAFDDPVSDPVNHPPHYKSGGIETIDFIEAKDLNYRLGNVVKYVTRAGRKSTDPIEDLQKAAWYLNREIDARKRA